MASAQELVQSCSNVFTLPEIYFRVRDVVDNPDSTMDDLARVLKMDPGISARLLKIVNSPLYGFPQAGRYGDPRREFARHAGSARSCYGHHGRPQLQRHDGADHGLVGLLAEKRPLCVDGGQDRQGLWYRRQRTIFHRRAPAGHRPPRALSNDSGTRAIGLD
jgi:hypothetical protein